MTLPISMLSTGCKCWHNPGPPRRIQLRQSGATQDSPDRLDNLGANPAQSRHSQGKQVRHGELLLHSLRPVNMTPTHPRPSPCILRFALPETVSLQRHYKTLLNERFELLQKHGAAVSPGGMDPPDFTTIHKAVSLPEGRHEWLEHYGPQLGAGGGPGLMSVSSRDSFLPLHPLSF